MPANCTISFARPEHLKAIPGIQVAATSVFAESDVPLDIRYRTTAMDVLQAAQESGQLWIATDGNDHVIGYAMVYILDGLAHLDDLDVHPEHARRGIGSAILRAVIDWAERQQYAAMTLVTFRHLGYFRGEKPILRIDIVLVGTLVFAVKERLPAFINRSNQCL